MLTSRTAVHLFGGIAIGVGAAILGLVWGPLTWTAAALFVVLSGLAMPRFAFLAGGLLGLGGTWLVLMLALNTPRPFVLVPVVVLVVAAALTWRTIRQGRMARS
jgi:hypothetical protein